MTRIANDFGGWSWTTLPGNSQVAISHDVYILPQYKGKGYGQKQHQERLTHLKNLGFEHVICTVNCENAVEKHILQKFGWVYITQFMSCGHPVEMWTRNLNEWHNS